MLLSFKHMFLDKKWLDNFTKMLQFENAIGHTKCIVKLSYFCVWPLIHTSIVHSTQIYLHSDIHVSMLTIKLTIFIALVEGQDVYCPFFITAGTYPGCSYSYSISRGRVIPFRTVTVRYSPFAYICIYI